MIGASPFPQPLVNPVIGRAPNNFNQPVTPTPNPTPKELMEVY